MANDAEEQQGRLYTGKNFQLAVSERRVQYSL